MRRTGICVIAALLALVACSCSSSNHNSQKVNYNTAIYIKVASLNTYQTTMTAVNNKWVTGPTQSPAPALAVSNNEVTLVLNKGEKLVSATAVYATPNVPGHTVKVYKTMRWNGTTPLRADIVVGTGTQARPSSIRYQLGLQVYIVKAGQPIPNLPSKGAHAACDPKVFVHC